MDQAVDRARWVDHNVTSLCELSKLSQATVSHHLGLLRMSGLVTVNQKGRENFYSLAEMLTGSGGKLRISLPLCRVTIEE